MQAKIIGQFQHRIGLNTDGGPGPVVFVLSVGHNRVKAVIATGQFQHHENAIAVRNFPRCRAAAKQG